MLGWELPPHNSGGLGVACYQMAKSLSKDEDIDIEFIIPYKADYSNIDFMKVISASNCSAEDFMQYGNAYDSRNYSYGADSNQISGDLFEQVKVYEDKIESATNGQVYEIIHAHDWLTFRAGLKIKMSTGAPLVLHVHATEYDRAGGAYGNKFVREIEETSFLLADKIVAVSNHTKNVITEQYGIDASKIEVVHNNIEIPQQLVDQAQTNDYQYLEQLVKDGYKVVSYIGRLTLQKNLVNLLYAAKKVIDYYPKCIFLIAGSGEQRNELIELSAELGISKNVIFVGFVRGKRWRDSFKISNLHALVSISEPFGLTPLESVAFGTPALVSKQSGVSEVMNNFLKVDFWDIDEIANQIVLLLENDSLQHELARNATAELRKLTWSNSSKSLMQIYSNLLDRSVV